MHSSSSSTTAATSTVEAAAVLGRQQQIVENGKISDKFPFRTYLLIQASKLVPYSSTQFIWCSYFIQKTTIFNPTDFLNFYLYFPKSTMIRKWPKMLTYYAQKAQPKCLVQRRNNLVINTRMKELIKTISGSL